MKIALCQINPTVGAFEKNKELILKYYNERTIVDTVYCSPTHESVLLCAFTALYENIV